MEAGVLQYVMHRTTCKAHSASS